MPGVVDTSDMTDTAKTPGYAHRLSIWFKTTKRGQRTAWYFSTLAGRAIRVGLADAELFIAQGQADRIDGHPLQSA